MRYIACFKPENKNLLEKIYSETQIEIPASGLHCTLWSFAMEEKNESDLLKSLHKIKTTPFYVEVAGTDKFENEARTHSVLLLSKPTELQNLHSSIIEKLRPLDKNIKEFDNMVNKYGQHKYMPHITILKDPLFHYSQNYSGIDLKISKYFLLKKKNGNWIDFQKIIL